MIYFHNFFKNTDTMQEPERVHDEDLPTEITANGDKAWVVDGKFHRGGGRPAVERANGEKEWWVDGQLHREGDLPAYESAGGLTKVWYLNGVRHRVGAPAFSGTYGKEEWWLNGKLHRDGGLPARILTYDDHREWYENGLRHRIDGPAYESEGGKMWYVNGSLHRIGGPAVENTWGAREWWENGYKLSAPRGPVWTDENKTPTMKSESCVITMEEIGDSPAAQCGVCHVVCGYDALSQWLTVHSTCPHCRSTWTNYVRYR